MADRRVEKTHRSATGSRQRAHFLGTRARSGTISGIDLKLPVYERSRVALLAQRARMSHGLERSHRHDIRRARCATWHRHERAESRLAGCAILEPCQDLAMQRLRVQTGVARGILATLWPRRP